MATAPDGGGGGVPVKTDAEPVGGDQAGNDAVPGDGRPTGAPAGSAGDPSDGSAPSSSAQRDVAKSSDAQADASNAVKTPAATGVNAAAAPGVAASSDVTASASASAAASSDVVSTVGALDVSEAFPGPVQCVLTGTFETTAGEGWKWSGDWFMAGNDKIRSAFEYVSKSKESTRDNVQFAAMDGYFMLKNLDGTERKVQETDVVLTVDRSSGEQVVACKGANVLAGRFLLKGKIVDGNLEMAKAYYPAVVKPVRKRAAGRRAERRPGNIILPDGAGAVGLASTPRAQRRRVKTPAVLGDGMDPDDTVACKTLLRKLLDHKMSAPFLSPVDPVLHNVPDYFTIIHNPMDLGTISKHLDRKQYAAMDIFCRDIELVFDNATLYNKPGNAVHEAAVQLRKKFKEELRNANAMVIDLKMKRDKKRREQEAAAAKAREEAARQKQRRRVERDQARAAKRAEQEREREAKALAKKMADRKKREEKAAADARVRANRAAESASRASSKKSKSRTSSGEADAGVAALMAKVAELQAQVTALAGGLDPAAQAAALAKVSQELSKATAKAGAPRGRSSSAKKKKKPDLSWEQKRQLSVDIGKLDRDGVAKVVEIIRERMDLKNSDGGDIEIDIDSLDLPTLRALQDFVKGALAPQKRPRSPSHDDERSLARPRVDDIDVTLGALAGSANFGDLLNAPVASDGSIMASGAGGSVLASTAGAPALPAGNLFDDESDDSGDGAGAEFF